MERFVVSNDSLIVGDLLVVSFLGVTAKRF